MASEWYVHIVEIESGKTEKKIGPSYSERDAERVERGVNINLDHERYFTCIRSEEEQEPDSVTKAAQCPECGSARLEMVEDALLVREVKGHNSDGDLLIESYYKVYDEGAENPRILCNDCSHTYDLPEDNSGLRFV